VTVPRSLVPLVLIAAVLIGTAAGGWLFGILAGG